MIAKLGVGALGAAMVTDLLNGDLSQLVGLGVLVPLMVYAYRMVSKAKDDRVIEYERIAEAVREENVRLRRALAAQQGDETADKGET